MAREEYKTVWEHWKERCQKPYRALRAVGTLGEQGDAGRVLQSRKIKIFIGGSEMKGQAGTVNRN